MTIFEKLQKSRVDFLNRNVKMTGKANRSIYYELADILPHINEILYINKLCSSFKMDDENAVLTIHDSDDLKSFEDFKCSVKDAELKGVSKIQSYGGSMTYCRRYLWIAAFDIVENDIIENLGELSDRILIGKEEAVAILERAKAVKKEKEIKQYIKKAYKKDDINKLTTKEAAEINEALQKIEDTLKEKETPDEFEGEKLENNKEVK